MQSHIEIHNKKMQKEEFMKNFYSKPSLLVIKIADDEIFTKLSVEGDDNLGEPGEDWLPTD